MLIKQLRWLTAFIVVVIFLSFITMSCGGGSTPLLPDPGDGNEPDPGGRDDPDVPDEGLPSPPSDHNLFGFAGIHFDSGMNAYVVDRSPDVHYNLTNALSEPLCPDCIEIETIEIDEVNHIIMLRISLRNPTTATYYDVRGICITNDPFISLIDPDGYITLFDDGGDIEWNPYYSYSLEKAERTFEPDDVTERIWNIHYTPGESYDFTLLVEGSHPGHCEDVARLFAYISDDTYITPFEQTGTLDVTVDDWQMDITAVHLHIPELDIELPMHEISAGQYDLSWDEIGFTPAGEYEIYVEAWSHNPDLIAIRQYEMLTVHPATDGFDTDSVKGYPYHGITPMRNNRSPYIGPDNLQDLTLIDMGYEDFIEEVSNYESNNSYGHTLRIDGDNQYSYGINVSYSYYDPYYPIYIEDGSGRWDMLFLLSPNGERLESTGGGSKTVLFTERIITSEWYSGHYSYDDLWDHQPPHTSNTERFALYSYTMNLEEEACISGSYWTGYPGNPTYYGTYINVEDCFPLLDEYLVSLERGPSSWYGWVVIRDVNTLEPVSWANKIYMNSTYPTGGAASPNGYIYYTVRANQPLLVCTNFILQEQWSAGIDKAVTIPVVGDNGVIYLGTETGIDAFAPDGTILWWEPIDAAFDMAINSSGDLLVVSKDSKELLCISGNTGDIIWGAPIEFDDNVKGIIIDAQGKILLNTDTGLYLFSSEGTELDSKTISGKSTNIVLGKDGVLSLVVTEDTRHYLHQYK